MRWPLQPLQPLQQTQLQPPFGQSVDSLCHPWFTATNVSYRFPILKLPPPPCAVLLVMYYDDIRICQQLVAGICWNAPVHATAANSSRDPYIYIYDIIYVYIHRDVQIKAKIIKERLIYKRVSVKISSSRKNWKPELLVAIPFFLVQVLDCTTNCNRNQNLSSLVCYALNYLCLLHAYNFLG